MDLKRNAREFYDLGIDTTPAVDGWELSVDGGTTWVAGEDVTGGARWLVRGPTFVQTDAMPVAASTLVPMGMQPEVRAIGNPEVVIRDAPEIRLLP